MAETKKTTLVLKKKKWYPILAPKLFKEIELGQTCLEEIERGPGRTIEISLMQITGEPQKQNAKIIFKITGHSEGKLVTEPIGYELTVTALKKMMRRGRTKIQDSILLGTEDNKKIRIKPVLVTKYAVQNKTRKELRRKFLEFVKEQVTKNKFETLIRDLVSKKFQRTAIDTLRKLCPIYSLDIGNVRIVEEKK